MLDSKLIEIIRTFSTNEIKSFEKFIASPYFARGRDVLGLFSIIKKYYPDFNIVVLEKKNIYSKLYPKEKYNEKKLKNLSFELTKLAEQFILFESFKSDKLENRLRFTEELKKRDLDKFFLSSLKTLENQLDDSLFDPDECFSKEEKFMLLREDYYFWKTDFDNSVKYRLKNTEYFTLSFLIKFLQRLRDKKTITVRYNKSFDNPLLESMEENLDFEKLLDSLRKKDYKFFWLLELFYHFYMCAPMTGNEEHYYKLKELFLSNIEAFSPSGKDQIFSVLTAYCSAVAEKGDTSLYREEFELVNKMFEHKVFTADENKFINPIVYRNIMLLALRLKEFEWLDKFAEKHSDKLKPEFRENLVSLLKANQCFALGEFERSLEYLNMIKYDIFIYKFDVKNLMLKIYYELGLYFQAYSLIDAYKHFLDNNKEHAQIHNKQYRNYINLYSRLLKIKENGANEDMDMLLNDIEKTEALASRIWLREKLGELQKDVNSCQ